MFWEICRLPVICHNWIWPSRSDKETDVLSVKRSCVGFSYFMSWQNYDCISPVRKVSGTMDFAEMCVTRLEQELCTQNFFFHSLSWWSIMRYEKLRFLILDFKQSFLYSWNYGGQNEIRKTDAWSLYAQYISFFIWP